MMHGHEKSDLVIVAMKPANKAREAHRGGVCGGGRGGVGGAKGGGQGEYAPAKHILDSEPGSRVTGAGAYTATCAVTHPRQEPPPRCSAPRRAPSRSRNLPGITLFPDFARAGGLLAYGPNLLDMYRQSGVMIGKVLQGRKPADLPIERPTQFQLVVNLRTARTLGLTIPTSILLRADEVIE